MPLVVWAVRSAIRVCNEDRGAVQDCDVREKRVLKARSAGTVVFMSAVVAMFVCLCVEISVFAMHSGVWSELWTALLFVVAMAFALAGVSALALWSTERMITEGLNCPLTKQCDAETLHTTVDAESTSDGQNWVQLSATRAFGPSRS